MRYLEFDAGESGDGITTFEAWASTGAAEHPAVMAQVQRILEWAWAHYPVSHGALDDGAEWDHDLQVQAEAGGWHTVVLTLGATRDFSAAFRAAFMSPDE